MSLADVANPQPSDLIAFDPSIEPVIRSVNGDKATNVTFVNVRPKSVHIYWRNYEGKRVSYGILEGKGAKKDQPTYLTHPWVVVDEETQVPIVVFNPATWNGRALIK